MKDNIEGWFLFQQYINNTKIQSNKNYHNIILQIIKFSNSKLGEGYLQENGKDDEKEWINELRELGFV